MKWSTAQGDAIRQRDVNLVVSAGAGSGKTAVLVERMLSLLEEDENLSVTGFLVMTFTEAAAGEMKQRIADGLQSRIERFHQQAYPAMAERFQTELESLWQAQISTIHSFCLDVVQQNLISFGLAADVRLMDDNEQRIAMRQAVDDVIEIALSGPSRDSVQAMMVYLRLADSAELGSILTRLVQVAQSQARPAEWLAMVAKAYPTEIAGLNGTPFAAAFCAWAQDELETAQVHLDTACQLAASYPELDKYQMWLEEARARVQSAQAAISAKVPDIDAAANSIQFFSGRAPTMSLKEPAAEQIKTLRKQGTDAVRAILPLLGRGSDALLADLVELTPHIATLCTLCESLMALSAERKRQASVIDFNDLEHFAYNAFTDSAGAALARTKARYQHVFVDEYQDTSPIQDAIVSLITDGNLFAVGDVKQSIYRFRMAEPSLFLSRYQSYRHNEGGASVDLTDNYRSRRDIVHFVNFAFSQLFSEATTGFAYDHHARMTSAALYPDSVSVQPFVEVHLADRSSNLPLVDTATDGAQNSAQADVAVEEMESSDEADISALERESRIVSRRILQMMEDGMEVFDAAFGHNRPMRFGDIAILLRSGRDALNQVLGVLGDAGIAASAQTSTGFYDALEIQWLIAALRTIDNPLDDMALLTLLRSPLFGWTEQSLARVRVVSGSSLWSAMQRADNAGLDVPDDETSSRVRAFHAKFDAWRQMARRVAVSEVLQTLCDDSGFLQYLDGMTRGSIRRANVEQLQRLTRRYDHLTGQAGIFGFLENWQRERDAQVDLGAATQANKDAVQVMTIHRSKGLEFPVVFVMDLGKQFRLTQDTLYLNRTLGLGAVAFDEVTGQRWRTMSSIAVSYAEKRETLAEETRILYVAFTRARERLILIGSTQNLESKINAAQYAHDISRGTLLTSSFAKARSYMDWLIPVLIRHPQAGVLRALLDTDRMDVHVFYADDMRMKVNLYNMSEIGGERAAMNDRGATVEWDKVLRHVADTHSGNSVVRILDRVTEQSESLFAKVTATDMRRLHVALTHGSNRRTHQRAAESLLEDPVFVRGGAVTPREQGVAFHAFMQRFRIPTEPSEAGVATEIRRLQEISAISSETAAAIRVADVVAFLASPIGRRMQRGIRVFREQPFFHRIDVPTDATGKATMPVVAQGVIDCLIEEADGWIVVDYKTDSVKDGELDVKAREYEAQVATYLEALRPLAEEKPVQAFLYFVQANASVEVKPMSLPDVFRRLMEQASQW